MTKRFLNSNFMLLCIGAAILLLYPILVIPKGEFELLINRFHFPALDLFFKYVTHLGDGSIFAILLIGLLFINYSAAILTAFSIVFQSILVSIFKRWIFKGLERPVAFFDEGVSLNFVDGVDVHSSNTFPSGHTATGFALFALIIVIANHRSTILSILCFILALCVGFSRVYLLQHFLIDVYFGAIIGIASVIFGLVLLEGIFNENQLLKLRNNSLKNLIFKAKQY